MFEGFERRRVDAGDGVSINLVTAGAGPPVLLLHGFPQSLAMWARVAPALAERYSVVCADLRGYGDSAKPRCAADNANYSFRAMAADQVAVMEALGHDRFHMVGHDRGARTGHRMALDHPDRVLSLTLMDIAPTWSLFREISHESAQAYWHWQFLAQPAAFTDRMIGLDPDFFYETCLVGWGKSALGDYDAGQLAEYRRCWRDPEMIHGSCADYRAAATVDLALDEADLGRRVECPALMLYGGDGVMARLYDLEALWAERLSDMRSAAMPGGHFFVDQHPRMVADRLLEFLQEVA